MFFIIAGDDIGRPVEIDIRREYRAGEVAARAEIASGGKTETRALDLAVIVQINHVLPVVSGDDIEVIISVHIAGGNAVCFIRTRSEILGSADIVSFALIEIDEVLPLINTDDQIKVAIVIDIAQSGAVFPTAGRADIPSFLDREFIGEGDGSQ